ncbi:DUF1292 domain-containing protein [Christensenella intestinihominis]|uniref:DUF1292 domain-containing protein n=1 Tax=Christensenella intestinihominis TaxID=1851429 RepID=UPI00082F4356|nr:DUF1292 domain-containing protein [Christensenella intestinihominis]
MNEEELNLIEMQDEEGNVMKFEHLLTFEVDEDFYVAFTPVEKMEEFDVGEVLIMRIQEDDEGDVYLPIETEKELDELWAIFQQLYYEEDEEDGEE